MLDELYERIDCQKQAAKWTIWHLAEDPLDIADWVREQQRKAVRHCYCQNDVLATIEALNYFDTINKTNNEKEKEKMDAKKCERCGKLYEMQDVENYIAVYLPGLSVSDYSKENYSQFRIKKDNTRIISVNSRSGQVVDLCPECREKLKNFFESGADETTVIKKAEE